MPGTPEEQAGPLQQESQIVVSRHVSAGNQTWSSTRDIPPGLPSLHPLLTLCVLTVSLSSVTLCYALERQEGRQWRLGAVLRHWEGRVKVAGYRMG